jgi:ATP synthase, F1 delta subunit
VSGFQYGGVAKRYASALVGVAKELGRIDEVQQELLKVGAEFKNYPALNQVMNSPIVKPTQKKEILKALAPKLSLSPTVVNLLQLMIDQDRLSALPVLVLIYRDQADEVLGRVRVQVKSATPLGAHEQRLKSVLEKSLKKEILMEFSVEPQILGGLVVRVKDQVFDASLKRELERLREKIAEQAVA